MLIFSAVLLLLSVLVPLCSRSGRPAPGRWRRDRETGDPLLFSAWLPSVFFEGLPVLSV